MVELLSALIPAGGIALVIGGAWRYLDVRNQRDLKRAHHVISFVDERKLAALPDAVFAEWKVDDRLFDTLTDLMDQVKARREVVRFSGPLAREFHRELQGIIDAYLYFRTLIEVPEWEIQIWDEGGDSVPYWFLNKKGFAGADGVPRGYGEHLSLARQAAIDLRNAFYRFQTITEIHVFEIPFARWLLPRRLAKQGLMSSKT